MLTSAQIRQAYIDFFCQRHGHNFVPSSPVVPHDDPTLLFTNAGMNQFKPYFLGTQKSPWTRVTNTQKCIRAGGKHNDLDDVGRSRRHHTFFEMLGNWSIGDYFKREAIAMSWELLTQVFKLDPTRLHVSCFEGDEKNGVPRDMESANLWKEIAKLPDNHIHFFGKDNFWEMGDTGPCGPCTEIYIDRTPDKTGGSQVNGDDPRVMEIWNNVFIQYNRNPDRSLTTLPAQHVDTGMGFERITQVLQNVHSNYEIDLFNPFWDRLSQLSGRKYTAKYPRTNAADPTAEAADPALRADIAFRVIADHIRCLTFALTDGAAPSNEGRGYVLRRILRRAVRFGRQQLELRDPFMHNMVPVVVDAMGDAFPELKKDSKRVQEIVKDEEVSFGKTLDRGIALFDEAARRSLSEAKSRISADDAFKLHDTYGFPIDLTRIMAEERGMSVDIAGYETLMEQARQLARSGGKDADSAVYGLPPAVLADLEKRGAKHTDDSAKFKLEPIRAKVLAIWNGSNLDPSADTSEDQEVAVILDRTNFYAEMGGQVGDSGTLSGTATFDVETTRVVGGFVLHVGRVRAGKLNVGDEVAATVSSSRRATMQSHTATHLANWALREVLGEGVQQKGSLVDPEKLRFDFSHGKSMTDDELARAETLVAERISQKLAVYAEEAPQEQAIKIKGLRAVFGEKYPPMVRVVSIGVPVADLLKNPSDERWRGYSIEFCGGTHMGNSDEIGSFAIVGEESVSKGVRRITALTGASAERSTAIAGFMDRLIETARAAGDAKLPSSIEAVQDALNKNKDIPLRAKRKGQAFLAELQSKLKTWEKSQKASSNASIDAGAVADKLLAEAAALGGGKLVVADIAGANDDQLRAVMDSLRKKQPSLALMLGATDGTKVSFCSSVSDDLIAKGLKAGDWIRETAKVAGGGGGGRPQMAQAGGKDPSKLLDALAKAKSIAQDLVK